MKSRIALAMALAFPAMASLPASAASTDAELKAIREQIREMKSSYEQRIADLEQRLQKAEAAAGKAESAAVRADAAAAKADTAATQAQADAAGAQNTAASAVQQASSRQSSEGAFNPAVSAILNGVYSNLSQDPGKYRITGFVPSSPDASPGVRGFSLGESELALSANADHVLRGTLIASIQPNDSIGIEEGYVQTIGLSNGVSVKAGRFFSSVSYLNEQHAHAWDFTDAPLASKAFLGNQLADDGIQIKWVAPTDTYFDLGAELGRGRSFPGNNGVNDSGKNGIASSTLFAHLGGDVGDSTSWTLGASLLRTEPSNRQYDDFNAAGTAVTDSFSGSSRLFVLGGVVKWSPHGNTTETNLKLQGEYFRRNENGTLAYDVNNAAGGPRAGSYGSVQSGWYLQAAYQFMPLWRVGYRYDRLDSGNAAIGLVGSGTLSAADFPGLQSYDPTRNTLMLDYSPSEFSRFRLQFAQDKSRAGMTDNQIFLQYIVSLGAHGAHKF